MNFLNVGYGNFIANERILAIVYPDSAPIKRMVVESKKENKVIDATHGKKTRSVIFMDNGYIVLATIKPTTVDSRAREGFGG